MKRFLALFLVCCLIVSALSVPAFAADSIVGRKWSCSTTGKTITVGSSDSLSYVFDASLGMNGFGSSPIENIYSSFPGWSGIKRSTSSLYTLPAGSTISYSVTISVSGFSGFGSSDLKPLGHISVCSVTDSGGWQSSVASSSSITPVISSGAYLYSFSGTVTLKDYVKTYAASLFFVFNLTGRTNNPINGKRLTCTVSSSDIFVKYLAGASSASEDQINSTVNNIYNTVINNNTEVIAQITNVIGVSGIVSLVLMIQAIGVTDLTKLVDAGGLTGLAGSQMRLYGILLLSLLVFALSIGRKADRPDYLIQTPVEKRKLRNRTIFATALILLLIPLTLFIGVYCFGGKRYYFISLLILLECMLPFFLIFEGRKPQARELVLIAVLVALNVAGRAAFFMLPEFKPVVAMTILAGVAFGGETGFLVGAMTMLVSNMLFSQGPWTPWQMFAMGSIGWLAGVLYRKGVLRRSKLSLCIFGVICSTVVFGGIMNPASALMWSESVNWKIIMSYYITGIPVDLVRAVATFAFLWLGAEPMLEKLDRVKTKYGLAE